MELNDEGGVVEVIHGRAEDIDLPVKVDIIVRLVFISKYNPFAFFLKINFFLCNPPKNELTSMLEINLFFFGQL